MSKPALGRGLGALLAGSPAASAPSSPAPTVAPAPVAPIDSRERVQRVPLNKIRATAMQPRKEFSAEALKELSDSIREQGIVQPLIVRERDGFFELIAGERRWRASQLLNLPDVPVIVREADDRSVLELALIENLQRENLNALEEAQGIKRLIDEFAMTHEKAADAVGRSRVAVSNILRLLTLSHPVQELLLQNKLDMGHARALIGLDAARQIMLANKAVQQNLSVREVETLAKEQQGSKPSNKQKISTNHDVIRLQDALSDKLGTKVMIAAKASGAGMLKISYSSLDQLDDIIAKISG